MRLLCGQSNRVWHMAAGRWPGLVGLLLGPSYFRKTPLDPWMEFALDNDAFSAWANSAPWSEPSWREMIQWARMTSRTPLWAVVPDVVTNRTATLANWARFAPVVKSLGWPAAMAVQDGMTPDDLDQEIYPDVVFVGGSDGWKFPNLQTWVDSHPRVHCARVNSPEMFYRCQELGCESVDGTGWFRDPSRQDKLPAIMRFLEGWKTPQMQLL
jgi:hypothetical protein